MLLGLARTSGADQRLFVCSSEGRGKPAALSPLNSQLQQWAHSSWAALSSLSPPISNAACHQGCRWPRESSSRPRLIKTAFSRRPRRCGVWDSRAAQRRPLTGAAAQSAHSAPWRGDTVFSSSPTGCHWCFWMGAQSHTCSLWWATHCPQPHATEGLAAMTGFSSSEARKGAQFLLSSVSALLPRVGILDSQQPYWYPALLCSSVLPSHLLNSPQESTQHVS